MSSETKLNRKKTNFERSLMRTYVTDAMIKKKEHMNRFASKITQNNPELVSTSLTRNQVRAKSMSGQDFGQSKLLQTMKRRLGENSTNKSWHQENQHMTPCQWEPTGWRYPFLHDETPPTKKEYVRPRTKVYKSIANEKLRKNYFKTSYRSQYKEKIGFENNSPKSSKKG
jgi:hypothetical protein